MPLGISKTTKAYLLAWKYTFSYSFLIEFYTGLAFEVDSVTDFSKFSVLLMKTSKSSMDVKKILFMNHMLSQ